MVKEGEAGEGEHTDASEERCKLAREKEVVIFLAIGERERERERGIVPLPSSSAASTIPDRQTDAVSQQQHYHN